MDGLRNGVVFGRKLHQYVYLHPPPSLFHTMKRCLGVLRNLSTDQADWAALDVFLCSCLRSFEVKPSIQLLCSCGRKHMESKCSAKAGFLQCDCFKPVIFPLWLVTLLHLYCLCSALHRRLCASVPAEYGASSSSRLCSSFAPCYWSLGSSRVCERHRDAGWQCCGVYDSVM